MPGLVFIGEWQRTAVTGIEQQWCQSRHHGTAIPGSPGLCRLQRKANSPQTCQGESSNL